MRIALFFWMAICELMAQDFTNIGMVAGVERRLALPAELTVVNLQARANPTLTTPQAIQLFSSIGATESNLISIQVAGTAGSSQIAFAGQRSETEYNFAITAPADRLQDLTSRVQSMQRQPPTGIVSIIAVVFASATPATTDAALQAAWPEMFRDLQTQAETRARLAGKRLGRLVNLDENSVGASFGAYPGTQIVARLLGSYLTN